MSSVVSSTLATFVALLYITPFNALSVSSEPIHLQDNVEIEWAYTTGNANEFVYVFPDGANQIYTFNPAALSIDLISHIPAARQSWQVRITPDDVLWPADHSFNVETLLKNIGTNVNNAGWAGIYYKYGTGCAVHCDWSFVAKSHTILVTALTSSPTAAPSAHPTAPTTATPTSVPSKSPSMQPTAMPTSVPSATPITPPTLSPIPVPTIAPTAVTQNPTPVPSREPTINPTIEPTAPTTEPTLYPTTNPSVYPTFSPSTPPTGSPSASPTMEPTRFPSAQPTISPTANPSRAPTNSPSTTPTQSPTAAPTYYMNPYCPMEHALASMTYSANLAFSEFAECATNDPAYSMYAGGSHAIDFDGKLTCNAFMSCCLCQLIFCGASGHGCDRLILGASAAIGVPLIYIQSTSAMHELVPGGGSGQSGASFYCDGTESCKHTSIEGRYISIAHCIGDYGCQNSVIRMEPAQNMILKCGGTLSCANSQIFIDVAERSQVSVIEALEFVGAQSGQSAVVTIRNTSPHPVTVKNLECIVGACQYTQFVVEGNVLFQNCNLPDLATLPPQIVSTLPLAIQACAQQRRIPPPYYYYNRPVPLRRP